jgi:hypothetical protein
MKRFTQALLLALFSGHVLAATMQEVSYVDQDAGEPPYSTRLLVIDGFMRIDDGRDQDDFVLLDIGKRRIYNVTGDRKEILQIDAEKVLLAKPQQWNVEEEVVAVPKRGKNARQVRISLNGTLCSQMVAVPGLMPKVVEAMRVYRETLANTQAQTFMSTPVELRSECELIQNVFDLDRSFKYGFPLEEEFHNGRTRHLSGYREVEIRPQLFVLPMNYRIVNMKDIRGSL